METIGNVVAVLSVVGLMSGFGVICEASASVDGGGVSDRHGLNPADSTALVLADCRTVESLSQEAKIAAAHKILVSDRWGGGHRMIFDFGGRLALLYTLVSHVSGQE